MIGQILGHYRIVEKIGEGGMGVVYRAHDERLDRDVALKLLPAGALANVAAVKSFRKEAQALSKLNHPNIATIHDFDVQDGFNFLVMEYVYGATLSRKIAAGPLSAKEVIRLGTQLAQGLQAAHSKGVIHRDLKPSNLAVTSDCRLKILDFGLARFSESVDPNLTQTSVDPSPAAGTLPYMAPELLQGQPADERTDIYAAGAVLYEMSTGQRLFPDKHGARLMDAILHRSVPPPRDLDNRVSAELQDIIQKALDKDPDRRYQSAKELKVDLQRLPIVQNGEEWKSSDAASPDREPLEAQLEIAHVLYMDIVEYSKFPMDQQKRLIEELQNSVRSTSEFSRAKSRRSLISLPSGDGMALVFFDNPESPCRCALELGRGLRDRSEIKLRMGIHTGLVYRTADINTNRNVAGGGINRAQRVMDCGDAGHILVSKAVADMLAEVSSWNGLLHDLGEVEVKNGARVHVFNLYTEAAGNPVLPKKCTERRRSPRSDSGKVERSRSKSGVRSKNGTGIKKASEITGGSAPDEPQAERRQALARHQLLTKLHVFTRKKLRVLLLAVVMLAILAFAVYRKAAATFTPAPAPPGVPSLETGKFIAVLPFLVEGDSSTLQPVSERVSRQLSAKLLALRNLWVASAAAVEDVQPHASLATIAGRLAANLVISGKVHGDNKVIQITVTVDEVASRKRLLNQKFIGARNDLLKLEDQISTRILQVLELNPADAETVRATPPPTDSLEAYDLYISGMKAYRGHPDINQLKSAIAFYEKAIEMDSNFALAYAGLADACVTMYSETNDTTWIHRAMGAAAQAEKLNENLKEAHLALGNVFRKTGKTEEAVKEFRRALKISPNCDACYRRLGLAYEEIGERSQAIIALQNAVTINPYYWSSQNELGIAYLQFGMFEKALAAFLRVVEVEPNNSILHENLGAVYFALARYDESIPEFEKAITFQSTNADTYSDFGEALIYLKRYAEAIPFLEKAVQMKPDNQLIVGNLADGYRCQGLQKKSVETYDRAILLANKELAVNPRDTVVLGTLATYHAKNGAIALAEYYIRRARAIDALDVELIYEEALIRALSDQTDQALDSLRLAFERGIPPDRANLDPDFNNLHENPRFKGLVKEFLDKPKH